MLSAVVCLALPALAGDLARQWGHDLREAGYEGRADLIALLQSDESKDMRFKASYLLSLEGEAGDAAVIEDVLWSQVWTEREMVSLARHISRLDRQKGIDIATRLLESLRQPGARVEAISMLAKQGGAVPYAELVKTLGDPDPSVRREAVRALGHLAEAEGSEGLEPSPTDLLIRLAEDESEWIRWQAVVGLGSALRRGAAKSGSMIRDVLCARVGADSSQYVRRRAAFEVDQASIDCAVPRESSAVAPPKHEARRLVVSVTPEVQQVTFDAPVFVEVIFENGGHSSVTARLSGSPGFGISFSRGEGAEIQGHLERRGGLVLGGRTVLSPGERRRVRVLLNEWYAFPDPGLYTIELTIPVEAADGGGEATIVRQVSVLVGDRVPERLRDICENLAEEAMVDSSASAHLAAKAVSITADEVCLESLSRMLTNGPYLTQQEAIVGLARLRAEQSVSVLIERWCSLHWELRARAIHEFNQSGRGSELMEALDEAGLDAMGEQCESPGSDNTFGNWGTHRVVPHPIRCCGAGSPDITTRAGIRVWRGSRW